MCDVSNMGKNICLQIDFKGGLFQILASEEKEDSFIVILFCFCFQSHSDWMQNCDRPSGFAAKVGSASKLHILHVAVRASAISLACSKQIGSSPTSNVRVFGLFLCLLFNPHICLSPRKVPPPSHPIPSSAVCSAPARLLPSAGAEGLPGTQGLGCRNLIRKSSYRSQSGHE